MRIGINTLTINRKDFGGGETYLYHILHALTKVDQKNEYVIFVSLRNRSRFRIDKENFETVVCPIDTRDKFKRIIYEQVFLPNLINKHKLDLFHAPNNILPLRMSCRSVLTIQYIFSFIMPNDYTPFYRRWYFNTLMKISSRKADKVISVSYDNTRQIIRYLGLSESKITTIYHGLDEAFGRVRDLNNIKACKYKYGINNDYILCVANNVLNKNLEGLIKAFDYLKQKYKIPQNLVIIGNTGFLKKRQIWLRELRIKYPDIIHTGFVDYKNLPNLYSGADAFVLPSYCESFGIPLLEAMACGVPIVTSNIFAMPEIIGNAGLKVNPYDFKEIGEAIYSILINPSLRTDLIRRGLERVKMFSWEQAARQTLSVYEGIYQQ